MNLRRWGLVFYGKEMFRRTGCDVCGEGMRDEGDSGSLGYIS